jgi:DNA-binding transcriptional LysR family regulator
MDRLKSIETFVRITELGRLAKAAKDLRISRPMASTYLRQLEEHLGHRLINRTTRQLSLTEIGLEYLQFCHHILTAFAEKNLALSRWDDQPRGNLKISSLTSFGEFQLARVIGLFSERFPEVTTSLILSDAFVSPLELVKSSFDIGFTMKPLKQGNLITAKVGEVHWLPFASKEYLKKSSPLDRPQDLERHNCLIHRSISADNVWRFKKQKTTTSVAIRGAIVTNSVMALRTMVNAGVGIALLPNYVVEPRDTSISRILPEYEGPVHEIFVASALTQLSRPVNERLKKIHVPSCTAGKVN